MLEVQRELGRAISLVVALLTGSACGPRPPVPVQPHSASPSEASPGAARTTRSGPIRRVVLITIDGLMPDSYLRPDELGLKIPTLRWLKERGASSDGVLSVFPTLTYPSHTSMVTGVNPVTHRIVANRSFDPMENDLDGWRWYAEDIAVPPVWQVAEEHGIPTAIVYWPVTVGAKVHWRVPEYWRAANEHDAKLQRVVATPGLLEAVARRHPDFWTRFKPPAIQDDALVDITEHLLENERPGLLLMHLVEVDTQQHRHGIGSPEARAAIEKDDAQVGRVLRTLERTRLLDETALIVASDHGFREAPNAVRPCTLLTEAGLITLQAEKILDWKATVHAHGGEAYVYLKDPKDQAAAERTREVFTAQLRDPKSGIARLYEAAELQQLGGDTTAAFALGAAPGYQFAAGCRGAYRVESNSYRATHGFDPRDADMRASLLMIGPSIPHGTIAGARLIDIAPTIAEWLGLPLQGVDGKPLRVTATR